MYQIDLATILQILQGFKQNSSLQAELPPNTAASRERCRVQLHLINGKIASCHILDSKGSVLLSNEEALRLVDGLGVLDWSVTPLQITPLQVTPPAGGSGMPSAGITKKLPRIPRIPRRTIHVGQDQLNTWPRKYRLVYVLIDGERSVEKIREILSLPPNVLEETLLELERANIITMEN